MSWLMRTGRGASARSGSRVTADISGHAPPAAVAPSPCTGPLDLLARAGRFGLGLEVMAVGLDEQLLLSARTCLRDDVLECFYLLGGQTPSFLDHPHARPTALDGHPP